jgi:hypothetical protein
MLRALRRTDSIIDLHGFVDSSVRFWPHLDRTAVPGRGAPARLDLDGDDSPQPATAPA